MNKQRDAQGTHYTVPRDAEYPAVTVWWTREPPKKVRGRTVINEYLVVRQDNGKTADVILLSLGQVYDLIKVLNDAVENT